LEKTEFSTLQVDPDFVRAWAFYRRLRMVVFSLFFVAMLEIRFLFLIPAFAFALTFVLYFFIAAWLANWKCPRCRQSFFRGAFFRSLFGGRCFHCGLPKWAVSETGNIISTPRFPFGWRVEQRVNFGPRRP
jgi:hypothetical protein